MSNETPAKKKASRGKRALKILAVVAVELILLFVLCEVIARVFLPRGLDFISPQMLVEPHPTRVYDHVPNQRAWTIDQPFHTNSNGFRTTEELPLDKGPEFRILSLGDSIAVGLGVAADDTYASQLERALEKHYAPLRVINGAVGSYSTWQEVDLLAEKGLTLRPDIVIIAFYWNDLYLRPDPVVPLPPERSGERKDETLQYLRLLKRSPFLLFLRARLDSLLGRISPRFEWTHRQNLLEGKSTPYIEKTFQEFRESLERFRALSESHEFVPVVATIPIPLQVLRADAPRALQERVSAIAADVGSLRVVDPLSSMRAAYRVKPDLYIPWDNSHLTPRGHTVVAEVLEEFLIQESLVP